MRKDPDPKAKWAVLAFALTAVVALGACGDETADDPLADLQLVGIDFELDSIILTNAGTDTLRTEGLWVYQDGEVSQFNIFFIEPRTEVLFSVRDVGGLDAAGGEIALYSSDSFSDPTALIEYVAWGSSGHSRIDVAIDGGRWNEEGPVETGADTIVILRADPALTGQAAWSTSDVIP